MTNYSIILEKYKGRASRHTCPSCRTKHQFALYIDTATGDPLGEDVGKCNKADNCGYHRTPKEFFEEQKAKGIDTGSAQQKPLSTFRRTPPPPPKPISFFSEDVLTKSQAATAPNNFMQFLEKRYGLDVAQKLKLRFAIGTSKHWNGATVFWQIDNQYRIRTGKIMLYNSDTAKRVKDPYSHINWAQSVLKLDNFNLEQCLYGLHQIKNIPIDRPIGVVESEKTAIICHAENFVQGEAPQMCWLAIGAKSNLKAKLLEPLLGRKVVLYPDVNGFDEWSKIMAEIKKELPINIIISDYLEKNASNEDRKNGLDLADFYLKEE